MFLEKVGSLLSQLFPIGLSLKDNIICKLLNGTYSLLGFCQKMGFEASQTILWSLYGYKEPKHAVHTRRTPWPSVPDAKYWLPKFYHEHKANF